MSSRPNPAEPETLATLHEQDARDLRVLLLGMAHGGATLAALYVEQAKEQAYATTPSAGPSPDCATAYDRVTRSVRRTVLLVQKLTEPAPLAKAARPEQDRDGARKQIIRRVEDAIHRNAAGDEAEHLHAEFLERLEGVEFDEEIGQRPITEIVHDIQADLGILTPDSLDCWKRRTPADITVLCARAAAPSRAAFSLVLPEGAAPGVWAHDAPPIRGP